MRHIKSAVPTFADFKAAYPINGEREIRQTWDQLSDEDKFLAVFYIPYHVSLGRDFSGIITTPHAYLLGGGRWKGFPKPIKHRMELKAGIVGEDSLTNRLKFLQRIRADKVPSLIPTEGRHEVRIWPA